jgi:hypothetical protein
MRRTALIALCSLSAYCLLVYFLSANRPADASSFAQIEAFRHDYLTLLLGAKIRCVEAIPEADGWIRVRYLTPAHSGCNAHGSPILASLAAPGRHEFKEVKPGAYNLGIAMVLIGKLPAFSPAFTVCHGRDCRTLLLDPEVGLGSLPGELMSDTRDSQVTPGRVAAHEIGHWASFDNEIRSKAEAVELENWYIYSQNPVSALRLLHDPAGIGVATGKGHN